MSDIIIKYSIVCDIVWLFKMFSEMHVAVLADVVLLTQTPAAKIFQKLSPLRNLLTNRATNVNHQIKP